MRNGRRIAERDPDILYPNADGSGHHLSEPLLDALTDLTCRGERLDLAGRLDRDDDRIDGRDWHARPAVTGGPRCGELDEARQTQADEPPLGAQSRDPPAQGGQIGQPDQFIEAGPVRE